MTIWRHGLDKEKVTFARSHTHTHTHTHTYTSYL